MEIKERQTKEKHAKENHKFNLKGRSLSELEDIFAELDEPAYRAKQAFRRINMHLAKDLDEFSEFPKSLRERLKELDALPSLGILKANQDSDTTEKALFEVGVDRGDGQVKKVEAVWIVSPKRRTVCISSQAGCTLNCTFCATGTLKFRGNLPAWQIVDQVYELIRIRGEKPSNVVFMGMGEPFHNYENVIRAARILHHPEGLNMGARHITISTAGVIPGIETFTRNREPFKLAISLNHPDPDHREDIMDVNKKYPLKKLIIAVRAYARELKRTVTFEYVMIPGVNMSEKNAKQLIKIARSVNSRVNLIPLNTSLRGFRRPTDEEMTAFQDKLHEAGVAVFNRGSPGRNINAACGMLALKN